ncbi:unnamed protein product, partial [marine sediment metagenome]
PEIGREKSRTTNELISNTNNIKLVIFIFFIIIYYFFT